MDTKPEQHMRRAMELAMRGTGKTRPNPLVGAVLVKNGTVIGEGWHRQYGDLHAEREALADCMARGADPGGATLYVTLEPCCHVGKQPPCTQAIVLAKIARVVVGSRDPNPLVHGKGIAYLREHGIEVEEDFLKDECDRLNEIFFHYITTRTPFVAVKYAMTADGRIATKTGESQWITGQCARHHVHELRNKYASILAGIGTVLADNPLLTCRIKGGTNPLRIVCDTTLRIPFQSRIVQTAAEIPTIVACTKQQDGTDLHSKMEQKKKALEQYGVEVLAIPSAQNAPAVDLKALCSALGEKNIDSVLIEGGAAIHASALESGIVQKIYAYVAPRIFGGAAPAPVAGNGVEHIADAPSFSLTSLTQYENDVLLEYTALPHGHKAKHSQ